MEPTALPSESISSESDQFCPKCGAFSFDEMECLNCGIIYKKYKTFHSIKLNDVNKNNKKESRFSRIIKSRLFPVAIFTIYLIFVVLDMIAVYENECKRPGREKLYSTIDMIEKYEQLNLLNLLKERTLDMIDRRERISLTIDAFEEGCAIIENGITVMRSEKRIKCIFFDGTSIQYDSVDDSVIIEKPDFRYEKLFSFLPNLFELHMVYKNIDYDLKAYEIQKQFPDIDFSPIEEKYNSMLGLAIVRITSIGIIIWLIPTLIVFLIIKYELIHNIYRLYSRFQNIIKNMFRKIVYARGSE